MSTRLALPTRRNHITQKVKIAGQRTLYLSVHKEETREQEFHVAPPGGAFSLVPGWAGPLERFAGLTYVIPEELCRQAGSLFDDSHTELLFRTPPLATVRILNLLAGCGA